MSRVLRLRAGRPLHGARCSTRGAMPGSLANVLARWVERANSVARAAAAAVDSVVVLVLAALTASAPAHATVPLSAAGRSSPLPHPGPQTDACALCGRRFIVGTLPTGEARWHQPVVSGHIAHGLPSGAVWLCAEVLCSWPGRGQRRAHCSGAQQHWLASSPAECCVSAIPIVKYDLGGLMAAAVRSHHGSTPAGPVRAPSKSLTLLQTSCTIFYKLQVSACTACSSWKAGTLV